ncbi:DUF6875 domain-containing protein [Planomonospora parontospora]|uniref:DUF6875 domain-containing protein n=1 Tax=Planomonospora parontospora TaxID=58119 RepID=UPI001670000B|nr:hypothetical protein [Planomonospora parontospora]GGL42082.1 hypothetical protein GCM10014719_49220 [Planomonospora parontospora subsp. antibiotica]GII18327.1 hypothetical protein Ppa05_50530 [Planomonospora parontospora subsp. antibiotica]
MIRHPDREDLVLFEMGDLDLTPPPPDVAGHLPVLRTVREWMGDYLCRPLPELGRRGAVCPYTSTSMEKGRTFLAVRPGHPADAEEAAHSVRPYREWFMRLAPAGETLSTYTTLMILFPDARREDLPVIDAAQAALKAEYVSEGLMIGEFHPGPPDKPGLWNPDLRPLSSPVAMLVIRRMVATDFPFLRDDDDHVRSYLSWFGDEVPSHLRESVRAAAASLS